MSEDTPLPEVLASERVYEGRVFDIDHDTIRFPDGAEAVRATVAHPGAVALVVIDAAGRWLLVEQYRHPARARLLEITRFRSGSTTSVA